MRRRMLERRKSLGMTQEQAAEKSGLTRANYGHIETGRREPSIKQMKGIARALKVPQDVSFFDDFCDETEQGDHSA